MGGDKLQYQVLISSAKLKQFNLRIDDIDKALELTNQNSTGGFFNQYGSEVLIRNVGRAYSLLDLQKTVVANRDGLPVLLSQVAEVSFGSKQKRGDAGIAEFVKSFRVYDNNDQDGIADWMRTEFPGMFYILASAFPGRDKREGIYRGMYLTGDESLTSRRWIDEHIRSTGPLGALYPTKTWTAPNPHSCLKEGDTPSWFFFLPLGGNDPSDPTQPGWGGQFQREPDGWYRDRPRANSDKTDDDPRTSVSRWRSDFQLDFAKRMAWCSAKQ